VEFKFPMVKVGRYRIVLEAGNGSPILLPGTTDPRRADVVTVGSRRETIYRGTLGDLAQVTGTVRGSWQETGSFMRVEAVALDQRTVARGGPASDGSFSLLVLGVQPVRVRTWCSGVERWFGGDSFARARTYFLQPGERVEGLSMLEGGIVCQLEGPDLQTSYRAELLLEDASGRRFVPHPTYGNSLVVSNLETGIYRLFVSSACSEQTWASQWYDRTEEAGAATPIRVVAGRATRINMRLEPGGKIEGRVLDTQGVPVPVRLAAHRNGVSICDYPARWDEARQGYTIHGLANGDYTIAAWLDNGLWWYPGTLNASEARVIQIREHAAVEGIEWRLPPFPPEGTQ
jgi:hypothetical protein